MPRLPIETRRRAIGMIQAGQSFTVVFVCCAVQYLPYNQYGSLPPTPTQTRGYVLNQMYCQLQVKWLIWYVEVEAELQLKSKTTGSEHATSGTDSSQQPELLLLQLDLITVQLVST